MTFRREDCGLRNNRGFKMFYYVAQWRPKTEKSCQHFSNQTFDVFLQHFRFLEIKHTWQLQSINTLIRQFGLIKIHRQQRILARLTGKKCQIKSKQFTVFSTMTGLSHMQSHSRHLVLLQVTGTQSHTNHEYVALEQSQDEVLS